jgi:alpha-ketoglutarate-dependent taurine dioxygenase
MVTMPEVHRVGGLIGAELHGLDLTRVYEDETYEAVLRAWAEYGVIFLRDQHLDAEQQDAFASRLGEIRVRQELRKDPEQTKAIGEGWHTTRFHWAPGSIAMWDNRQTWHFAVNDYQGQRRVMHRILLAGSKPVPAA